MLSTRATPPHFLLTVPVRGPMHAALHRTCHPGHLGCLVPAGQGHHILSCRAVVLHRSGCTATVAYLEGLRLCKRLSGWQYTFWDCVRSWLSESGDCRADSSCPGRCQAERHHSIQAHQGAATADRWTSLQSQAKLFFQADSLASSQLHAQTGDPASDSNNLRSTGTCSATSQQRDDTRRLQIHATIGALTSQRMCTQRAEQSWKALPCWPGTQLGS